MAAGGGARARLLHSILLALLTAAAIQGEVCSEPDGTCNNTLPTPTPLQAEPDTLCDSDYVCAGRVRGCICDGYPTHLRKECPVWGDGKRRGKCMCEQRDGPLSATALGVADSEGEVPSQHVMTYLIECPPCHQNYQGQLSPDDLRGCRMPTSMLPNATIGSQNSLEERAALDLLYNATMGVLWLRGWDLSAPPCQRDGVQCRGQRVVGLELSDNNLQGQMPASLPIALPLLERLDLSRNKLSGQIPGTLGALKLLTYLSLAHNRLGGSVPDLSGCHYLSFLDLSHNTLTGALDLSRSMPMRLVPPITPPQVSAAGTQQREVPLIDLRVQHNGLSTLYVPPPTESIGVTRWRLQQLDLSHNIFTGILPRFFLELPELRDLDLSNNLLTGQLPDLPDTAAFALRRISLRGNALTGSMPPSWKRLWDMGTLVENDARTGSGDGGLLLDLADTCVSGNLSHILVRQGNLSQVARDTSDSYRRIVEVWGGLRRNPFTGLQATFYESANLGSGLVWNATRTEFVRDVNWAANSTRDRPSGSLSDSAPVFKVRWTGFVRPGASGQYSFFAELQQESSLGSAHSERVKLWIDNSLIIDAWSSLSAGGTATAAPGGGGVQLVAESYYSLKMEYKCAPGGNSDGAAQLCSYKLLWGRTPSAANASFDLHAVSANRLFYDGVYDSGLHATYYDKDEYLGSLGGPITRPYLRVDASALDWSGAGDSQDVPTSSLTNSEFMVRWSGFLRPKAAADYSFFAGMAGNQGERLKLWVDNALIIDQWASISAISSCSAGSAACATPDGGYTVGMHNMVTLQDAVYYPIQAAYKCAGGTPCAYKLLWEYTSPPSSSIEGSRGSTRMGLHVVPADVLFSTPVTPPTEIGLQHESEHELIERLPSTSWWWWQGVIDLDGSLVQDCLALQRALDSGHGGGGLQVKCKGPAGIWGDDLGGSGGCGWFAGNASGGLVAMVFSSFEVTSPQTFVSVSPISIPVKRVCPPSRDSNSCGNVSVAWRAVGWDAREGVDFLGASGGWLSWAEGDTSIEYVHLHLKRAVTRARAKEFTVELVPVTQTPISHVPVVPHQKRQTRVRLASCASTSGSGQCAPDLTMIKCGDGRRDLGEECDVGPEGGGGGCTPMCAVQAYWYCYGGTLTHADQCFPMSAALPTQATRYHTAAEAAFAWLDLTGVDNRWFSKETYEGYSLYPIFALGETKDDLPASLRSSHIFSADDFWPEGVFWPNDYWQGTDDALHWLTPLGCAPDPYDAAVAHEVLGDDSAEGRVGSGLVSLAGAHACGILAYHKGYSGFCLGRNGRCHTQFTFFEMLLGIGGTRVQGAAGGPTWNLPRAEGCGLRGGAMAGSDGSMFCYQLNSNPCLSDLDFYKKRSSQHSQLPCSVHASCTFSIGSKATCSCDDGYEGNGEVCRPVSNERECGGPDSLWEDGTCFKYVNQLLSWTEARAECVEWGGELASLRSQAQTEVAVELLLGAGAGSSKGAWIGIEQVGYDVGSGEISSPDWLPNALEQQTEPALKQSSGILGYSNWLKDEDGEVVYLPLVASNLTRCGWIGTDGLWNLSDYGGCGSTGVTDDGNNVDEKRYGLCARRFSDVDECLEGLDDCDIHSTCLHPVRTYNCSCHRGYSGYGRRTVTELTDPFSAEVRTIFRASFPASSVQLSRLAFGSGMSELDGSEWLDRPHALLAPEGRSSGVGHVEEDSVYIEADIGRMAPLGSIRWWMYFKDKRRHRRVRVETSVSGEFRGEEILLFKCFDFTDCGVESAEGRQVDAHGVVARYVRVYVGRASVDATVRFLRLSVRSSHNKGCAPCPLNTTFDGAGHGECVMCHGRKGNTSTLLRVEGAPVGCGLVEDCDQGRGRGLLGSCFRYFGPKLWADGDVPSPVAGQGARQRDGAVAMTEAVRECKAWGGGLASVQDRARMDIVRSLLQEAAWVLAPAWDESWGNSTTMWGAACLNGTRSGDCPQAQPGDAGTCVVMGLGGVLRNTTCSGRRHGGQRSAETDRGVVRGWVCERKDTTASTGTHVPVKLALRSSSGATNFDVAGFSVSSNCGNSCVCDAVTGCSCDATGMFPGELVSQLDQPAGWWEITSNLWFMSQLPCYVEVTSTDGSFAQYVMPVSSQQIQASVAIQESAVPMTLRMMAVETLSEGDSKGVRAVVAWGDSPQDLDLHVYKDSESIGTGSGGSSYVCSNEGPVMHSRRSSFGGVALDVDSMHGYGPETVTFDDSTQDGAYHLVVHSKSREESWLGTDAHALIVLRGSSNLIIVKPTADVLEDTCHTQECVSGSCCYWWLGTVSKTRGNAYDFASANVVIGKPSTC